MDKVENDMYVSVSYTGTLQNGEVFDSSEGRQPLEIQMGAGQLIKGFENALVGMSLNEKKTFTLDPEDAYGIKDDNLVREFAKSEIPSEMNPETGQQVALNTPDGQQIPAQIVGVDDEKVTVDMNHPLAGESLTFKIEVVGINEKPAQPQGCGCGCDCSSGGSC
ncbi:MAG: peptidylprolyl isomerase [Desulfobacteraceae bacterium]|nr:peptidylprolyl isomerase [Desulfobacteraceae bacterium]